MVNLSDKNEIADAIIAGVSDRVMYVINLIADNKDLLMSAMWYIEKNEAARC
jgi:hypothetical protein